MGEVFLLLGTNLGDRAAQLAEAIQRISTFATILKRSSIYGSQAWGTTTQPDFLNQVIQITTDLAPLELLERTLDVEAAMGRRRIEKWGPRLIDIDLLFYDDVVMNTPRLTLPHPEIQNRRFTLVPLNEIAPGLIHPVVNKTIAQLNEECPDPLEVYRHFRH